MDCQKQKNILDDTASFGIIYRDRNMFNLYASTKVKDNMLFSFKNDAIVLRRNGM